MFFVFLFFFFLLLSSSSHSSFSATLSPLESEVSSRVSPSFFSLSLCSRLFLRPRVRESNASTRETKPSKNEKHHQNDEARRAAPRRRSGDRALRAFFARLGLHPLVQQRLLLLRRGCVHLPRREGGALRLDQGGKIFWEGEGGARRARKRE